MTMSLDAAAQVMRDAMREKVKRHSLWYLVQGGLMILAGILALVYPSGVVVRGGFSLGRPADYKRHRAGHQSHRRARSPAFLASTCLSGAVGDRRCAFDSPSWVGASRDHAAPARVLHG